MCFYGHVTFITWGSTSFKVCKVQNNSSKLYQLIFAGFGLLSGCWMQICGASQLYIYTPALTFRRECVFSFPPLIVCLFYCMLLYACVHIKYSDTIYKFKTPSPLTHTLEPLLKYRGSEWKPLPWKIKTPLSAFWMYNGWPRWGTAEFSVAEQYTALFLCGNWHLSF